MRIPLFKLVLTREAEDFLRSLPLPAQDKMAHNIQRIAKGERNSDIFKKLENTEIWEFRSCSTKRHTVCSHFGIRTGRRW